MKTADNINTGQLSITERLFKENEIKTNRMVWKALLIFNGFIALFAILGLLDVIDMAYYLCCQILLVCCMITIIACVYLYKNGFDRDYSKTILIHTITLISGVLYFLYPRSTIFIMFGPILLSIKYYDQKFVFKVTLISWSIYMISVILNTYLDTVSETMRALHEYEGIAYWSSVKTIIGFIIIPRTFVFTFEGIISCRIAEAGRNLVITQAELSGRTNMMESDLKVAAEIQNKALPPDKYVADDGSVYINAYQSQAKEVGGDFYDYFMINNHTIVMLVADVSDKGLPSSMFVIEAQSMIRFALSEVLSIKEEGDIDYLNLEKAINSVNRQLTIHNMDGMFVTMWIGCIDIRSGIGKYINAGHNQPYIRRADGSMKKLDNDPQIFLGCFEENKYQSKSIGLYKGATLVLYTDGVTDARNKADETFGTDNLEKAIKSAKMSEGVPASECICDAIVDALDKHIDGERQYDDVTILALTFEGNGTKLSKVMTREANDESTAFFIDEINEMLESVGCPDEIRRNIDVVIDEICTNVAMYAYGDGTGSIRVEAYAGDNYIAIKFIDEGMQFDPLKAEDPDLSEPRVGGLGIYLAKNLVDLMNYSYDNGKNTVGIYKLWEKQ